VTAVQKHWLVSVAKAYTGFFYSRGFKKEEAHLARIDYLLVG
jgi:hypothetical protein